MLVELDANTGVKELELHHGGQVWLRGCHGVVPPKFSYKLHQNCPRCGEGLSVQYLFMLRQLRQATMVYLCVWDRNRYMVRGSEIVASEPVEIQEREGVGDYWARQAAVLVAE